MGYKNTYQVELKNVSIGDQTARLGVKIPQVADAAQAADILRVFCGARLDVKIAEDQGDQQSIAGLEPKPIVAHADCKNVSVSPKAVSFGLTFSIDEIDTREMGGFAQKRAVLQVTRTGNAKHKDDDSDDEQNDA